MSISTKNGGLLLLFWCFSKLLAVVDHSQMRSWGNFFLSERSVNIHWTHTIPAAGMVWQHLRQMFSNFFNKVGYCLCLKLVWTFLQRRIELLFLSVRSFLGCLWRILPWTTLSYSSRSWMDRRNSILLFGSHSHCSRFKVKGLKHFTSSPQKIYYIFLFFWEKMKFRFLPQFFAWIFCPIFLDQYNFS